MKLKKWIKQIDCLSNVIIWDSNSDEEPLFEGVIFDIPWVLTECQIGRANSKEEPIYLSTKKDSFGNVMPLIVINLIIE